HVRREPEIEQPVTAGLTDQLSPVPGRVSVTCTEVALALPGLETTMVKPIGSPALTTAASAVFVMAMPGWAIWPACMRGTVCRPPGMTSGVGLMTAADSRADWMLPVGFTPGS